MALRRFYLNDSILQNDRVLIRGELFHHIRDVCRFAVGDRFELLPGDGQALLAEVTEIDRKEIHAQVLSLRSLPPLAKPYITLALSLPKLPKVDWIVEKCVELGVHEVRVFVSDFSFLRKLGELSPARLERWRKLIQGATQQSGRGELMRLGAPTTLKDLLAEFNRAEATGGLFPYEGEAQLNLQTALSDLKARHLDHLWVFVGSEGGFSPTEVEMFRAAGLDPVSLGDQILRVETACLALVSVIKYEIGTLR